MGTVCLNEYIYQILQNVSIFRRYFNFEPSLKLRWCRARDLFGSQIPVTTGGFELRIIYIQSRYLTHQARWPSGLGNDFVCNRFAVQTLPWSLEFIIRTNLEHNTIAIFRRDRKSLMYMQLSIVNFLLEVNNQLSWTVDEVTVAVEKSGTKGSMFSLLLF